MLTAKLINYKDILNNLVEENIINFVALTLGIIKSNFLIDINFR